MRTLTCNQIINLLRLTHTFIVTVKTLHWSRNFRKAVKIKIRGSYGREDVDCGSAGYDTVSYCIEPWPYKLMGWLSNQMLWLRGMSLLQHFITKKRLIICFSYTPIFRLIFWKMCETHTCAHPHTCVVHMWVQKGYRIQYYWLTFSTAIFL